MSGLTDLPGFVGKLEQLVAFLAESWHGKDWVRRLMLLDVLLLFLNPPLATGGLKLLRPSTHLPSGYGPVWMGAVATVFLAGLVVAAHGRAHAVPVVTAERRAIKGLVAFELQDAEIFARLQREQEMQDCLVALTNREFRFGFLNGESGSGKTSFLQAGLWPRLVQQGLRCAYVKFSDQEPGKSVRQCLAGVAATVETDGTPGLAVLLEAAGGEGPPLVLFFDQFEQVFVHRTRQEREPFIQELAKWYQGRRSAVKILLCLRSDFVGHLVELQKAMGYSLGPQQVFRLEKLEPSRAAAALSAMGEMAGMAVDESFVEELAREDLADREDGLVSPVDLQVLAWMIAGQRIAEERAFHRDALRKMGGVEGLLERFLERALSVRETEARRQAAIKVLLLLTDLEQNVRGGLLSAEQLAQKKDASLSAEDLRESLDWLARSDVRLVARAPRDGETVYELAHERLIPALRRLAGRALTEVDRAGHLLDRRVNEWLGNGRAARYLLTWRELRLIEPMRPYLYWGLREAQKRELITRSRQRRNRWLAGTAAVMATAPAVVFWLQSPWGALWQVKRELAGLVRELSTQDMSSVALGFAVAGDNSLALRTVEQTFQGDKRLEAYLELARLSAAMGRAEIAADLLGRSRSLAEKLRDQHEGADSLAEVSGAALDAYDATGDPALWTMALESAKAVKRRAASLWVRLAETGAHHGLPGTLAFLEHARQSLDGYEQEAPGVVTAAVNLAEKARNPTFLDPGIQAAASLDLRWRTAEEPVARLVRAAGKFGAPQQKRDLRRVLDGQYGKIQRKDMQQRAEQLAVLAKIAAALGEPERPLAYVAEARSILADDPKSLPESDLLWSLDLVAAGLGKKADSLARLRQDIDRASSADPGDRLGVLPALAERAAAIGEIRESFRLLSLGVTTLREEALAHKENPFYDDDVHWARLGGAAVRIGQQTRSLGLLVLAVQAGQEAGATGNEVQDKVVEVVGHLAETSRNPRVLTPGVAAAEVLGVEGPFVALARAAAGLGDRRLAAHLLDRALQITAASFANPDEETKAYAGLAETAAAIHQFDRCARALDKGAEAAGRIQPESSEDAWYLHRSRALMFALLARSAVTAGDRRRAETFLERAGQAMQEHARFATEFPVPGNVAEWWKLSAVARRLGDRRHVTEFLEKGFAAAQEQRPKQPASWLSEALEASQAGDLELAHRSAARISEVNYKAGALICILAHQAERDHPKVADFFEHECKPDEEDE